MKPRRRAGGFVDSTAFVSRTSHTLQAMLFFRFGVTLTAGPFSSNCCCWQCRSAIQDAPASLCTAWPCGLTSRRLLPTDLHQSLSSHRVMKVQGLQQYRMCHYCCVVVTAHASKSRMTRGDMPASACSAVGDAVTLCRLFLFACTCVCHLSCVRCPHVFWEGCVIRVYPQRLF